MSRTLCFESTVKPDWIDHNGHMNVAYYVLAFDEATDAAYEVWGIGLEYPTRSGCSVFTLGMNVDYRSELFESDAIRIDTTLVHADEKRIHYFHEMVNVAAGMLAATNECLCMNVNLDTRKAAPFPADVLELLDEWKNSGDPPKGFGRVLGRK